MSILGTETANGGMIMSRKFPKLHSSSILERQMLCAYLCANFIFKSKNLTNFFLNTYS